MIRRILLSALLVVVLSCQNETSAPSAPQESTGALALRVVSAQALAPVESVLVRLTWSNGFKEMKKHWRDSSMEITGLPRKETISVRMEGWSWVQGRRTVSWSGDTATSLESANADWNVGTNTAVIRIVPVPAPSLSAILPVGDTIRDGVLSVELLKSRTDTIRLDTTGVDTVFLGGKRLPREGGKFLLVVSADTKDTVLVVGHQGRTSWFRVRVSTSSATVKLPQGIIRTHDTVRVVLVSSRTDTLKLDTAGIDSVALGNTWIPRKEASFPLVVNSSTNDKVRAVAHNGGVDSFRVIGSARPLSRDSLVVKPPFASWVADSLKFEHAEGASDTVWVPAAGVDSVVVEGSALVAKDGSYRVVVSGVGAVKVVVTGKAGQKMTFHVVATASAKVDNRPGLSARLIAPALSVVGKTCSLRVRIDSGDVSAVVLLKDSGYAFASGKDSVWSLVWTTAGSGDSLQIHVYGTGKGGKLDTIRIGKMLSYDRAGPFIAMPVMSMLVGRSGGSIAWSVSDAGGIDSVWHVGLSANPCTDSSGVKLCRADSVKKTFEIHARDIYRNESRTTVKVDVDSVAPVADSVVILGGRELKRSGDTIKVDSGTRAAIRWKAHDASRGFQAWVKEKGASDSTLKRRAMTGGWDTANGLGEGTWTLTVRDSFGNEAAWGTFVVFAEVKPPVDSTKELAMELVPLPRWVGKSIVVTLKRTAGRVDSIVWGGPKFATTADSTYWTATWTPAAAAGAATDSLSIRVHGHTASNPKAIQLGQRVNLDREGPKFRLIPSASQSGDTLRVGRIERDSLRIQVTDTSTVKSVWLTGTSAKLDSSTPGTWRARMDKPGDLMAHARDTLGNEDSTHVHVVFLPSVTDTAGPVPDSVVGARGKLSGSTLIPRLDDKSHVGLKFYSKEPKFRVVAWSGKDTIYRADGKDGVAIIDTIPMEYSNTSLDIGLFDSLGNLGDWRSYVVLPFVSVPEFSDASGVYGSDRIVIDNGVEKFKTVISCQEGMGLRHQTIGNAWASEIYENGNVVYTTSVSHNYRCSDPSDVQIRSDTTRREYILLLRPEFVTEAQTFSGTLAVHARMNNGNDTIPNAGIQYCLGDSTKCSAGSATWSKANRSGSDFSFAISATTTVAIRVYVGNVRSHASYRKFTKDPNFTDWTMELDRYAGSSNALQSVYGASVWAEYAIDSAEGSVPFPDQGYMELKATWETATRQPGVRATAAIVFPLDKAWSTYDFTGADSITLEYNTDPYVDSFRISLLGTDHDPSLNGLQHSAPANTVLGKVVIHLKPEQDLWYPSWSPASDRRSWTDIKDSILALRFMIQPKADEKGLPYNPTATLSIKNVVIHGVIRKND